MIAFDFFRHEDVALPRERGALKTEDYLRETFSKYTELVESLDISDPICAEIVKNKSTIKKICVDLISVLEMYQNGFPSKAYSKFSTSISAGFKGHMANLVSRDVETYRVGSLYRMRSSNKSLMKPGEMFHIPFDQRHRVATQRYSIPGLPSLYLGGSLFIDWIELGMPDFNQLMVSRFEFNTETIKILDFSYRPEWWSAYIEKNPDVGTNVKKEDMKNFIVSQAVCWPMVAACSIKVLEKDAHYKPEYIIPQLLLEWIRIHKELNGIRYFSVNVIDYPFSPKIYSNYVFPVTDTASSQYCSNLSQIFNLTQPMQWQMLKSITLPPHMSPSPPNETIEVAPGVRVQYYNTEFGDVENKLYSLPAIAI